MLAKHRWDDLAKRILDHVEKGTRDLSDDVYEMPVNNYLDRDRWLLEIDIIFKKDPVILAFGCQLAEPDSYIALSRAGVPILLTRGRDGKVRGFLNKCRHRGSLLTGDSEKCGVAKGFACPYHAWSFDNKGKLVGLPARKEFGNIPEEYQHLIPISVEERAGFIWGILTPGIEMNLDLFLGDMLPLLEELRLKTFNVLDSVVFEGANWKIAMDGYIENYHFDVLHKDTFAGFLMPSSELLETYGPHQRFIVGHPDIKKLRELTEEEWKASKYVQLAYNVFPNCAFAFVQGENREDLSLSFFQVWPGPTPETSIAYGTFLASRPLSDVEKKERTEFFRWTVDVIKKEDYGVGFAIQDGLTSMEGEKFIYGRMEKLVQNFQRSVNRKVEENA